MQSINESSKENVTTEVMPVISDIASIKPAVMHKRIGSIVYEVVFHFNPNAKETINDKKLRLIRRDMEAAS